MGLLDWELVIREIELSFRIVQMLDGLLVQRYLVLGLLDEHMQAREFVDVALILRIDFNCVLAE